MALNAASYVSSCTRFQCIIPSSRTTENYENIIRKSQGRKLKIYHENDYFQNEMNQIAPHTTSLSRMWIEDEERLDVRAMCSLKRFAFLCFNFLSTCCERVRTKLYYFHLDSKSTNDRGECRAGMV